MPSNPPWYSETDQLAFQVPHPSRPCSGKPCVHTVHNGNTRSEFPVAWCWCPIVRVEHVSVEQSIMKASNVYFIKVYNTSLSHKTAKLDYCLCTALFLCFIKQLNELSKIGDSLWVTQQPALCHTLSYPMCNVHLWLMGVYGMLTACAPDMHIGP